MAAYDERRTRLDVRRSCRIGAKIIAGSGIKPLQNRVLSPRGVPDKGGREEP